MSGVAGCSLADSFELTGYANPSAPYAYLNHFSFWQGPETQLWHKLGPYGSYGCNHTGVLHVFAAAHNGTSPGCT